MMRRSSAVLAALTVAWGSAMATARPSGDDDPTLAVSRIPPSLRAGSKAVVRSHIIRFRSGGPSSATLSVERVVTILDASVTEYRDIFVEYDKFRSVGLLEAEILDSGGTVIRELDDDDVRDYSAFQEYELYSDNRVKYARFYHPSAPYTLRMRYEVEQKGVLGWPSFYVHETRDAVERAVFEVRFPAADSLRWWCNADSVRPVAARDGGDSVYTWEVRNIPALPRDESFSDYDEATVVVRVAPNLFELEGHAGTMTSWKALGEWNRKLWEGRTDLTPEAVAEVARRVKGVESRRAKAEEVYRYVQSRTRYVSVQLGIGGWQPFPASYVHTRGYGDCKALSNYTIALLGSAGIDAYPVLVRSGTHARAMITQFPSNQFDHVIVCVPLEADSLWLECTSQVAPPGHLGSFTEGRPALLLAPDGGRLVRTPSSSAAENARYRTATMAVYTNGRAELTVRTLATGNMLDDFRSASANLSASDRRRWVLSNVGLEDLSGDSLSLPGDDHGSVSPELAFGGVIPQYAARTGKRLFVNLNPFRRHAAPPADIKHRRTPVVFEYPYTVTDTVMVRFPAGFTVEAAPRDDARSASFGSFSFAVTQPAEGMIRTVLTVKITDRVIAADNYAEYRAFFVQLSKVARSQVVLLSTTGF